MALEKGHAPLRREGRQSDCPAPGPTPHKGWRKGEATCLPSWMDTPSPLPGELCEGNAGIRPSFAVRVLYKHQGKVRRTPSATGLAWPTLRPFRLQKPGNLAVTFTEARKGLSKRNGQSSLGGAVRISLNAF